MRKLVSTVLALALLVVTASLAAAQGPGEVTIAIPGTNNSGQSADATLTPISNDATQLFLVINNQPKAEKPGQLTSDISQLVNLYDSGSCSSLPDKPAVSFGAAVGNLLATDAPCAGCKPELKIGLDTLLNGKYIIAVGKDDKNIQPTVACGVLTRAAAVAPGATAALPRAGGGIGWVPALLVGLALVATGFVLAWSAARPASR